MPALERQGVEVVGIDAGPTAGRRLPWAARYHLRRWWHSPTSAKLDLDLQRTLLSRGYRADLHWDLALRERRAARARRAAAAAGLDVVLHMTANALGREPVEGLRQVAFVDATWVSQTKHRVPGGPGRYPGALVAEGDAHEREAYAHLEHVFTMGEWLVEAVAALGVPEDRITNVGTGLRNRDADLGHDPEPHRMFMAAKDMEVERGLPAAVEALRIARRVQPELTLVIAGDPGYPERFGSEPGVEAHGFLAPAEVDAQLDRASLLVNPSAYQTWGQINLEAMNARTPVLALDRLAVPEITEGGRVGFVVRGLDPQEIAEGMLKAFADLAALRAMGEEARTSVRARFSWDRFATTVLDVLDGVADHADGAGR